MITAIDFLAEIRKRQTELKVSDKELRQIARLSPKQWRSRTADPDQFRLGEALAICNYLGIKKGETKCIISEFISQSSESRGA